MSSRTYLAAGPWMKTGTNCAVRIVLHRNVKGELAVHNQNYEQTGEPGREVNFSSGDYFKDTDYNSALLRWTKRNNEQIGTFPHEPGHFAPPEMADLANAADLANQYYVAPGPHPATEK